MAFSIKKPAAAAASSEEKKTPPSGGASAPKGLLVSGAAAKQMMEKAEAEREAAKAAGGRTWRFWIKENEDAQITFLDGELDPDTGILKIMYANEHRVKINGKWEDVVCLADQEPCPICEAGERRSFVGYLTIIDHREFKDKDGKTHTHKRRLFVAKSDTLKQLTKIAEKAQSGKGLVGMTFDVSRTGDKKPAVGDVFMMIAHHEMADIVESFGEDAQIIDYADEAPYLTAEQMQDLGIGKKVATIGSKSIGAKGASADDVDDANPPW